MSKFVRRISHQGKEILFLNGPGLGEEDGIAAWEEMKQEIQKQKGSTLILVDSTGITMAPGSVSKAKEAAAAMKENPGNRIAFVGLSGLQKSTAQLIAKGLHLDAHFAKTLDEAREWLVKAEEGRRQSSREQRR